MINFRLPGLHRRSAMLLLVLLGACASATDVRVRDAGPTPIDAGTHLDAGFRWRLATPCPVPRFEAMGVEVNDKLLVMGGFTSGSLAVTRRVDLYDPATDTWSQLRDLPGAQTHVGLARMDGGVALVGGLRDWPPTPVSDAFRYLPSTDRYETLPPLASPRAALGLVSVGGMLHAVGGLAADGQSDSAEHAALRLDDVAAGWQARTPLPNPRNHLGAAGLGSQLLIVAGRHGWDEANGDQSTLSVLEAPSATWSDGPAIPLARSEIAGATFARGQRVYVVGGSTAGARPSSDVSVFDSTTQIWSNLPPLPGPLKGAVADAVGNQIVVTTGSPTGTDPTGVTYVGCCIE